MIVFLFNCWHKRTLKIISFKKNSDLDNIKKTIEYIQQSLLIEYF